MQTLSNRNTDYEIELYDYQIEAASKLHSGSILVGGVGTGKTLTGLHYYKEHWSHKPLYVITTPKKRDERDWEIEAELLGISITKIDSWNSVKNYKHITNAFFIFDEQRAVGYGEWAKSFISIAKKNHWIMLSATPGDNWIDLMSVFIANGFYENKSDFVEQHVEYDNFVKFPKIKRYHNQGKLMRLRNRVYVAMPVIKKTLRQRTYIETEYDEELYDNVVKLRWNHITDEPIKNASELLQLVRRVTGASDGRIHEAAWQMSHHRRMVIFYNYTYELEILKDLCEFLNLNWAQWNGKAHEPIPDTDDWMYLVQYTAGAEGWNCTSTDTMMFYSPNYSYKITEQSEGRIDRINTKYVDLKYIYLTSKADIDKSVLRAVMTKKAFNQSAWTRKRW